MARTSQRAWPFRNELLSTKPGANQLVESNSRGLVPAVDRVPGSSSKMSDRKALLMKVQSKMS